MVTAYYGASAAYAYFFDCSTGWRQGMREAQRFPEDYDGIIAGVPAANWTRFEVGGHLQVVTALNKEPEGYVPASKLRMIEDAVNPACAGDDGVRDGILNDSGRCAFGPGDDHVPRGAQRRRLRDAKPHAAAVRLPQ